MMTGGQMTLINWEGAILVLFALIRLLDWFDLRPELRENLIMYSGMVLFMTTIHYRERVKALERDIRQALERRDAGNPPLLRPGASPEPNKI